jgi:hypothetical protein
MHNFLIHITYSHILMAHTVGSIHDDQVFHISNCFWSGCTGASVLLEKSGLFRDL